MTHDELLAKIDEHIDYGTCGICDGECYKEENMPWVALRAVVELHKPLDDSPYCEACVASDETYPCPTIQTTEKELK